jgi:hypothetical protein
VIVHECANCGAIYPQDHVRHWGRTKESDALGPRPKCVELVESQYAPTAPNGEKPREVCGGALVARDLPDAELTTRSASVRSVTLR